MAEFCEPKEFVEKIDSCVTEHELTTLCARFIPDFDKNTQYKIVADSSRSHETGCGGYNRFQNTLLKDGVPVIVSIQRIGWSTTSDDVEDYTNERVQKTFLLQADPMAKNIFDAIEGVRCSKCKSSEVACIYRFIKTGQVVEYAEWTHVCQKCGHKDVRKQRPIHACSISGCKNSISLEAMLKS